MVDAAALLTAWEDGVSQPPTQRALTLLATVWPDKSADEWGCASVGERDGRLLHLREELFGSKLEATAECRKCGERLELTFETRDIRAPAPIVSAPWEHLRVQVAGYELTYRVPTSADLMEIGKAPIADARETLLKRCVQVAPVGGATVDPAMLPEEVIMAVMAEMARADPQADVQVALTCPVCSHNWSMPFDILSYLWSEIEDWAQRVLLEVHALASAYGWSERDIVAMSPRRRRLYLDMVGA
jgi:hypothetical protein